VRRLAVLLVVLCCALPAAPAVASPGLETIVQDDRLLLHQPPDDVRAAMGRLEGLGVDRVRLTAAWSTLTRDAAAETKPDFDARDPAAYEHARWRGLDTAVRLAREAGLSAVIDIGFWGPHWATNDPPGPRARTDVDPGHFADFAVAVARRYSGSFTIPATAAAQAPPPESQDDGVFDDLFGEEDDQAPPAPATRPGEPLPAVDRFILWNEPNHQGLLMPQYRRGRPASPILYRAMLRAAYPAAKAVRPDAAFLIGNTSSVGGTAGVSPLRFVRELACVDERLRPQRTPECADHQPVPGDGWAHHPYARNEAPGERIGGIDDVGILDVGRLSGLLRTLARAGRLAPAAAEVHLTEFGYETGFIEGRPKLTEEQQAQWLTWAEAIATRTPGVKAFAQFLLADQPPAAERINASPQRGFGQYFSGLLHVDGRPKVAAQTFTAGLFAQRSGPRGVRFFGRLRLGEGPRAVTIERSVRGPGGPWVRVAALTVGAGEAFEATGPWARGARYRLTWPGADGARVAGPAFEAVPAPPPGAGVAVRRLASALARGLRARRDGAGRFATALPGRLTVRLRHRATTSVRSARTTRSSVAVVRRAIVETTPYRVRLRATRRVRAALRRGARLTVIYAEAGGAVASARRTVRVRSRSR